jgi:hypothetical protein
MAYIFFLLKDVGTSRIHLGLTTSDCHLFTALTESLGGRKFKDVSEVETVVRRCLVAQDTDWYQQGLGGSSRGMINAEKWRDNSAVEY